MTLANMQVMSNCYVSRAVYFFVCAFPNTMQTLSDSNDFDSFLCFVCHYKH